MEKSKVTAIVLTLLLGGIGIHKFYLGQNLKGILYLLFFWTSIPALLAIIDLVKFIIWDDAKFQNYVESNYQ